MATVAPGHQRALPRRRPGRPTLADTGAVEVLLEAVRAGNRLAVAARLAGVAPGTVEEWMRRGRGLDPRPPTPLYVRLVEAVEEAEAAAEADLLAAIVSAAPRDWKAAAWLLSNRSPEWRQHRLPPEPPAPPEVAPPPRQPEGETIIIPPDIVRELASRMLRDRYPRDENEWESARATLVEDTRPL